VIERFATILLLQFVLLASCSSNHEASQPLSSEHSEALQIQTETPQAQLSESDEKISKSDFGDDWPFTVEEGLLSCKGGDGFGAVIFSSNGITYAVNGIAKGRKIYNNIEAIWADNPAVPGLKKNIGIIIDRGLKLCK
jgi:hypothetical protein